MKPILAPFGSALVGVILSAVLPLRAAVSVCDEASLRAALAIGGEIAFNCDTTILLTNELVVSTSVTLDASGHDVNISGDGKTRILQVEPNGALFLIGLTLRDGLLQGTNGAFGQSGGSAYGGAIRLVSKGTLRASDCRFINNRALGGKGGDGSFGGAAGGSAFGGAILSQSGDLFLTNCSFSRNVSAGGAGGSGTMPPVHFGPAGSGSGGAVYISDGLVVAVNCSFTTNGCSLTGGAIDLVMASGSVSNCVFVANSSGGRGGAIHHLAGLTVSHSRFIANSTRGRPVAQGGAICSSGDLTVAWSQFTANSIVGGLGSVMGSQRFDAGDADGGAICILSGVASISDSTFNENSGTGGTGCCPALPGPAAPGDARGGAIYTQAQTTIQNATFVGNAANGGDFVPGSYPRLAGMGGAVACGGAKCESCTAR